MQRQNSERMCQREDRSVSTNAGYRGLDPILIRGPTLEQRSHQTSARASQLQFQSQSESRSWLSLGPGLKHVWSVELSMLSRRPSSVQRELGAGTLIEAANRR